jgi:FtsP/CotA-like multicopper oxidase with cupredoxin domain
MDRFLRSLAMSGIATAFVLTAAWHASLAIAQGADAKSDPAVRPDFSEPVTLASKNGVLELTLTAHQGYARLDTVAGPVQNFLVFAYQVARGVASNGEMSGDNLYPAPTLQVFPGETLIVHLDNALTGLTIRDYFNPQYTAKGKEVLLYPEQMTSSPLNLHVHGVHVSPKGNSDNVMLHISPGMANTYTYQIPKNMPQGAYWYHSHLHTLTTSQTYYGLAGLLAIGRPDGNLPLVTATRIPIRNMVLQYNYVFDRIGGLTQLNNVNWPQYVSTITSPKGDELANGTYRPLLTPVNFSQSKLGEQYFTVWYAGPLSIRNDRGLFQFIPSNMQRFTVNPGQAGNDVPANSSLPDYQRDVQFTVNGLFQPVIKSKAGQTEIWVLANVSDFAYMNVELTETATGKHPQIAILSQDGNPFTAVHYPVTHNGTRLLIPPATRYAIAVTVPATGDLVLEMPPRDGAKTISAPGILYTNNGTVNPPAALGSLSVLPSAVSYVDGFFVFPTQVLATAVPSEGQGVTTAFAEGQALGAYTSFVDVSKVTPDVKRELVISGGFLNDRASKSDPKAFVYAFDGAAFPNTPLIQPRLGSVEEWTFINKNNDEHPQLPSSPGTAPAIFSTFSPYADDRSGVSVSSGFVDFMSGRNSIVTAPGPGSPAEVKVFNFSLMTPIRHRINGGAAAGRHPGGASQPTATAAFMPFGDAYRGGVSLATGWLAGSLGGAERIVVSQLAKPGVVKVYSSGSALQGGPIMYLDSAMEHHRSLDFAEIANLSPFGKASGVRVATTSTTSGADLLVSGISPLGKTVQVRRFVLPGRQHSPLSRPASGSADLRDVRRLRPSTAEAARWNLRKICGGNRSNSDAQLRCLSLYARRRRNTRSARCLLADPGRMGQPRIFRGHRAADLEAAPGR